MSNLPELQEAIIARTMAVTGSAFTFDFWSFGAAVVVVALTSAVDVNSVYACNQI